MSGGTEIGLRVRARVDWNEADYSDPAFQISHWGQNYPRLLALKKQYDPQGLFYGHHSVGSELWSADGNCRLP